MYPHCIGEVNLPPDAKFFLGINIPPYTFGANLIFLADDAPEGCVYSNSSWLHITVLSPRVVGDFSQFSQLEEAIREIKAQPIRFTRFEFFEQGIIVLATEAEWLKSILHAKLLQLPDVPASDPRWSGDRYNPHHSVGKTNEPEEHLAWLRQNVPLPYEWMPVAVTLFVRLPGHDRYQEWYYFYFASE